MTGFDYTVITNNLSFLLDGMLLSLVLAALAISGGIFCGSILAVIRLSTVKALSILAAGYVNLFRSIPLILVVFWFYFLVPLAIGTPVGPFYSVLIAFILFETAYYCEIIRAGIQSISHGQVTAALASGMNKRQAMLHVVLPQAFRNMVPIIVTQCIILFQDTSLVYVVTLRDFMTSASIVANRELRLVEIYTFAALVYLIICFGGSLFVRHLQRKLEI